MRVFAINIMGRAEVECKQRSAASAFQAVGFKRRHEIGVLGRVNALLNNGQNGRQVAANECGGSSHRPGKYGTPQLSVGRGCDEVRIRPSLSTNQSTLLVEHEMNDVFSDAVATISVQLVVQVITDAARGDLGDQIGCAFDIAIFVDLDLAAMLGWMKRRPSG